jgi:hypothetical protein
MLAIFFLLCSSLVFIEENEGSSLVEICSYLIIISFLVLIALNFFNILKRRFLSNRVNQAHEIPPSNLDLMKQTLNLNRSSNISRG